MTGPRYQFADFEVDTGRFELLKNGQVIRLERKPLELLILLAKSEGRLITRNEIAEHLWEKEVFVDTEHGINTAIRKIRAALRDNPEKPRFLQTVTRSGYRFLPLVQVSTPQVPASSVSPAPEPVLLTPAPAARRSRRTALLASSASLALIASTLVAFLLNRNRSPLPEVRYEQLTDLTDAAVAPTLSPDGRSFAFLRAETGFGTTGPLYIKSLTGGEIRLVTSDPRVKYGPVFLPDGTRLAYTVFSPSAFTTYAVPVSGGEPQVLLNNAAGLHWLDAENLLFSRNDIGIHLGVVQGTLAAGPVTNIYFPSHQRGMAHFSDPSPDHKWILVVEMDAMGGWGPCRLVALTGSHQSRAVGPRNGCTAAAWSRDGSWMFFTATVNGRSHVWRQRFPEGQPQQITFGATEEEGLAVEPSGNAFLTSVGTGVGTLWLRDASGEQPLTSEGDVLDASSPPLFRHRDADVFYLSRRPGDDLGAELWRVSLSTGKSEAVLPRASILDFDLSADGSQAVYSTPLPGGDTELFLARLDQQGDPVNLHVPGGRFPHFGPDGRILFQVADGNINYIEQIRPDGAGRALMVPFPVMQMQSVSPGANWAVAMLAQSPAIFAVPLNGGAPHRLCNGFCTPRWSSDGHFLLVPVQLSSGTSPGRSLALPLGPGETLPALPAAGIGPATRAEDIPGSRWVASSKGVPGRDLASFAMVKRTVQRNIFRLTLR